MKKGSFDYQSDMKDYYKSDDIAEKYFKKYNEDLAWRGQIIANRERNAVSTLLKEVNYSSVLDIPTGTGKLAPVFAGLNSSVLACDISENMLEIAKQEYDSIGYSDVRFKVCDAEDLTEIDESFDVAVCLRLLHRVPRVAKKRILRELGSVAEYVIASTGIESTFHKLRRGVRESLMGGDKREHCYETIEETKDIFSDGFHIIKTKSVLPVLSQEKVFLLKPVNE